MIAINIDGKIKTFEKAPKKWNKTHYYHTLDAQTHYEDGFRDFVTPTDLTETQKLGKKIFDAENDVFTYAVASKTPEELEQEKIQKQKIAKEKIKQEKLDKYVKEEVELDPIANIDYYDIWVAGAYQIPDRVQYKGKLFENTVADNTNAPDKGGWTEIKE